VSEANQQTITADAVDSIFDFHRNSRMAPAYFNS
jgi:hypothetical protein